MYSGVPLQILPLKISPVVGALNVVDEWLTAEKLSNNTIVMYVDSQFDLCCSLSLFSLSLSLSLSLTLSLPPSLPLSLSPLPYSLHSWKMDFLGSDSPAADKPLSTLAASSGLTGLNL